MKKTKEYDVVVCDECNREDAFPCMICGKDLCHGHMNVFVDTDGSWGLPNGSYSLLAKGYCLCPKHIEEIKECMSERGKNEL